MFVAATLFRQPIHPLRFFPKNFSCRIALVEKVGPDNPSVVA